MTTARKSLLIGGIGFVVLGAGWIGWQRYQDRPRGPAMSGFMVPESVKTRGEVPVLFESPAFAMTDQNGHPTSNKELAGRVWIADFIFTSCSGACPKVTEKMVEVQKALADEPDIRFVSFSVDPARDDPKTLKAYGEQHNPGDTRWLLLRPADQKAVIQVAQKMAAIGRSTDAHDSIPHTDFFILIDPSGRVRGLYDSKKAPDVERLKMDARKLLQQRAASKSG